MKRSLLALVVAIASSLAIVGSFPAAAQAKGKNSPGNRSVSARANLQSGSKLAASSGQIRKLPSSGGSGVATVRKPGGIVTGNLGKHPHLGQAHLGVGTGGNSIGSNGNGNGGNGNGGSQGGRGFGTINLGSLQGKPLPRVPGSAGGGLGTPGFGKPGFGAPGLGTLPPFTPKPPMLPPIQLPPGKPLPPQIVCPTPPLCPPYSPPTTPPFSPPINPCPPIYPCPPTYPCPPANGCGPTFGGLPWWTTFCFPGNFGGGCQTVCYPDYCEPVIVVPATGPDVTVISTLGATVSSPGGMETAPAQLPRFAVGTTVMVKTEPLGAQRGQVILQMGDVALAVELKQWNANDVQCVLPMIGLAKPVVAQLHVVRPDGSAAQSLEFELLPAPTSDSAVVAATR